MSSLALTVFTLFVICGVLHYAKGSSERDLILPYLYVICQPDRMAVVLEFSQNLHKDMTKEMRDMIWLGKICIGNSTSDACCSRLNMTKEHHIVSSLYNDCDMVRKVYGNGFNFVAQVKYYSVRNIIENFKVECAIPFVELKAEMIPTRFNLTVPDFYRLKQQPPILRSIPLGSTLFLMAEPNTRGLQQRLRTYPKQCWINFTPEVKKMQKNGSFKRTVIENGCAVYDKEMLAIIKQDDDGDSRFASWTKIAIPISKNLIAFSVNGSNKNGQYGNITVSCEIFICSGNMLATFQNVPLCPRSKFCSQGDHQIPDWLILYDSSTQYVELEGSITVVTSNNSDSDSVSLPSNYLFIEAENVSPAEEVQSGLKTEENAVQQQVVCPISEGIPIYAVIFISILSFAFGLIFVASLWIIHNKTDPLRKIRCMEPSRAAALASVYRDPIVRSTNSTAFMAVPVNERQRLVIDMP